jgi:hypothetical protein
MLQKELPHLDIRRLHAGDMRLLAELGEKQGTFRGIVTGI